MKVKELINELRKMPPEAEVLHRSYEYYEGDKMDDETTPEDVLLRSDGTVLLFPSLSDLS